MSNNTNNEIKIKYNENENENENKEIQLLSSPRNENKLVNEFNNIKDDSELDYKERLSNTKIKSKCKKNI